MCYAGIGSRKTPADVLEVMRAFAYTMGRRAALLRTGGALGADQAFMSGCKDAGGRNEIYVPWDGYERESCAGMHVSSIIPVRAIPLAMQFHPAWSSCSAGVKKLHARNCMIVLGAELNDPVDFIICWTPAGAGGGGTGQALRLARAHNVPILDLGLHRDAGSMLDALTEISKLEKYHV